MEGYAAIAIAFGVAGTLFGLFVLMWGDRLFPRRGEVPIPKARFDAVTAMGFHRVYPDDHRTEGGLVFRFHGGIPDAVNAFMAQESGRISSGCLVVVDYIVEEDAKDED